MLHFPRWKTITILLVVALGILAALPNVLTQSQRDALPHFFPTNPMTLGLDLQGGSYILLEVDRNSLINDRLQSARDEVRLAMRNAGIAYSGLAESGQLVDFRLRDPSQAQAARTALQPLLDPISSGMLTGGTVTEFQLAEPQPGVFRLSLTDQGIDYRLSTAVSQSIEVVRRRVDEVGTTEPIIQRQGLDRIMVQVPGLDDPDRLKSLLDQTAQLTFRLVDQTVSPDAVASGQERAPAGTELLYTTDEPPFPILVQRQVMVSGEMLTDAQAGFSQNNQPVVNIRFDSRGAQRFGAVTQQNVNRPFAIVLDNQVLSAPNINEPILGGSAQISGNFTTDSANDLAVLLRAGALPATLNIIEERTVGPGLGADSIAAGQNAGIIAAILVVVFMIAAYGFLGLIANVALFVNVVLLVALLSFLGATLTLPGIAGIVLTMGMAVDSNVLIYERMLEERRAGRSALQSIDAGFQKAFGTIIDANITSLIAAAVLFFLGSGPIRGFAVTFALGILTTLFTATTLTRWLVAMWVKRSKPKEVPIGYATKFLPNTPKIRFMAVRNFAFAATILASIGSIAGFGLFSLNYGIDFTGGTVIEAQARGEAADVGQIRQDLSGIVEGEVQVQEFGGPREVLIRYAVQPMDLETPQASTNAVRAALSADYDFQRVEVVGPTVSGELAAAAILGVIGAMLCIMVYIWLRFEWQFAIGAIASTFHDIILMVGFLVITRLEFNLSSIAAILTIVGYSLNDTIVVYDRMRENLRKYKKMPIAEVIDLSLNETLRRTILTGVTMMLALVALYFFGGDVIRVFVLPMIVGVLVGVYSSVFIAGPMLIFFQLRKVNAKGEVIEDEEPTPPGVASANRS